jgi:hypothetical protein
MRVLKLVMVVAVAASGCVDTGPWDVPGAELRAESRPTSIGWWLPIVREAADTWNRELEALGCPAAFVVPDYSLNGHPVRLVANEQWDDNYPNKIGLFSHDKIEIRQPGTTTDDSGDAGRMMTGALVHELGHAMGFGHVEDPLSVMNAYPETGIPTESDIQMAAVLMGCRVPGQH